MLMNLINCTSKENPDKKDAQRSLVSALSEFKSSDNHQFSQNMITDDLYDSLPGMAIDQEERVLYVADSVSSKNNCNVFNDCTVN